MTRLSEIFIAGGQPTITYNPRSELKLEEKLDEYLDTGHKILGITGPTKSGKTVLVRSRLSLEDGCWISGGQIVNSSEFWDAIIEKYEGFTDYTEIKSDEESVSKSESVDGELNAVISKVKGTRATVQTVLSNDGISTSRKISPKIVASNLLRENKKIPLIIDDFHYIAQRTQMEIVRHLKDLIYDGLKVIIISVPHRAYDPVKVEREMTGRLTQLQIPLWEKDELKLIMELGFKELNVKVPSDLIDSFATESFGSPHLAQDFCQKFCRKNHILESVQEPLQLEIPQDMNDFFKAMASDSSKSAFDRLSRGPRQRTDRKERTFIDGSIGDIYSAVLLAIAKTGPSTSLTYEEIRNALRNILKDQPPEAHEVTRVLDKMTEISKEDIAGEPVLDYDKEMSTLYISDPFFAYYLKWGTTIP